MKRCIKCGRLNENGNTKCKNCGFIMMAAKEDLSFEDQYQLAVSYMHGEGVMQDKRSGLSIYQELASKGYSPAMRALGLCYMNGNGITADTRTGAAWLIKAMNAGNLDAIVDLGDAYQVGNGVPADEAKAFQLYRKAADKGHPAMQYKIGLQYSKGKGVEKNLTTAFSWFLRAAEGGYVDAEYMVALMYYLGNGVQMDLKKAYYWHSKAAEGGCPTSQIRLALAYNEGTLVPKDCGRAFYWCEKAAKAGLALGEKMLGQFYENGTGTYRGSNDLAAFWYRKAKDHGDPEAEKLLNRLSATGYFEVALPDDAESQYQHAIELYRAALSTNDTPRIYTKVESDNQKDKALEIFMRLGHAGHFASQHELVCHLSCESDLNSQRNAGYWLQMMASSGDKQAMLLTAACFINGKLGFPSDSKAALAWLERCYEYYPNDSTVQAMLSDALFHDGDSPEEEARGKGLMSDAAVISAKNAQKKRNVGATKDKDTNVDIEKLSPPPDRKNIRAKPGKTKDRHPLLLVIGFFIILIIAVSLYQVLKERHSIPFEVPPLEEPAAEMAMESDTYVAPVNSISSADGSYVDSTLPIIEEGPVEDNFSIVSTHLQNGRLITESGKSVAIPNGFSEILLSESTAASGASYNTYNNDLQMLITVSEQWIGNRSDTYISDEYNAILQQISNPTGTFLNDHFMLITGFDKENVYYYQAEATGDMAYRFEFHYPSVNKSICDKIVESVCGSLQ